MPGDLIDVLRNSDLLALLPDDVLGPLAEQATVHEFAAGDVIFDTGDAGETLFIVQSGSVEIRRRADREIVLANLRKDQSFGELAAFDDQPRSAAAVAKDDTVLVGVTREHLTNIFNADPKILMATVSGLARSLTKAKEQVTLMNRFLADKVRERTEEVRQTQLEVIRRLGRAAEFRDDDTGEHIYRMSHYSNLLALASGFDEDEAEELLIAAPMHDVGKIGIPDSILLKPGKLDDAEWDVMRAHTLMGAQMLAGSRSPAIQLAKRIALEHHERWDGRGYPHGIRGEDISIQARICTIADVFDALTSTRPYKEAWTIDAALEEIEVSAGTMFDPELAARFVGLEPQLREIQDESRNGTLLTLPTMRLEQE